MFWSHQQTIPTGGKLVEPVAGFKLYYFFPQLSRKILLTPFIPQHYVCQQQ